MPTLLYFFFLYSHFYAPQFYSSQKHLLEQDGGFKEIISNTWEIIRGSGNRKQEEWRLLLPSWGVFRPLLYLCKVCSALCAHVQLCWEGNLAECCSSRGRSHPVQPGNCCESRLSVSVKGLCYLGLMASALVLLPYFHWISHSTHQCLLSHVPIPTLVFSKLLFPKLADFDNFQPNSHVHFLLMCQSPLTILSAICCICCFIDVPPLWAYESRWKTVCWPHCIHTRPFQPIRQTHSSFLWLFA